MVDIDLGLIKGPKGDPAALVISGDITEESTDEEAASAKAVYELLVQAMGEEY